MEFWMVEIPRLMIHLVKHSSLCGGAVHYFPCNCSCCYKVSTENIAAVEGKLNSNEKDHITSKGSKLYIFYFNRQRNFISC